MLKNLLVTGTSLLALASLAAPAAAQSRIEPNRGPAAPARTPARAPASAPAATAGSRIAVPPIAFTTRTLPNGLRVYALRDTCTANVTTQIWYDVGSKDDPAGRSG